MIPDEIKGKYILIDLDLVRYRTCFAAQKANEIEGDNLGFRRVRHFIDTTIEGITGGCQTSSYEGWLSGATNFRSSISTSKPYKGNRADRVKPNYFEEAGDYLREEYFASDSRDGLEADDELAIRLSEDPKGRCIASNDKDFLQVSGWHYNWVNGTARWVSRKAGDFSLYTQILTGDSTDNVPGIARCGPIKASKILKGSKNCRELFERTWNVYRTECGDNAGEYFKEQGSLVYLLRRHDDNFQSRKELNLI